MRVLATSMREPLSRYFLLPSLVVSQWCRITRSLPNMLARIVDLKLGHIKRRSPTTIGWHSIGTSAKLMQSCHARDGYRIGWTHD